MKWLAFACAAVMLMGPLSAVHAAPEAAPIGIDQMRADIDGWARRVTEIETQIQKMNAQAVNEKDVKWKMCLDDILATIKGVSASILSARNRMEDMIRSDKKDAAQVQFTLIKGLADAAERAFTESQGCPRQLTRVDTASTIEKEEDTSVTGTRDGKGGIGDAMGQDFTEDFATERDPNDLGAEDPIDGAGTDTPGGPTGTPANTGGDTEGPIDTMPPFVEPSPEK